MSFLSRRKLITGGLATAAGASGLAVAARLASRYGLIPPDHGGIYAPGETLTYAAQRILTRHSMAREFPPELDLEDAVRQWQAFAAGKLFAVASRWIRGLAAAGGRNGCPPRILLAYRFAEASVAQPDHAPRLRRGMVVYRRVDGRASFGSPRRRRNAARRQIRGLLFDRRRTRWTASIWPTRCIRRRSSLTE